MELPSTQAGRETNRLAQGVLIGATLGASWLAMQIVHEAGHVCAARAVGGRVERVSLHPLRLSRTDVALNPAPRLVAWAGPAFGSLVPCVVWELARRTRIAYLLRFFAGFCVVANGAYLGGGVFAPVGDAADILSLGGSRWALGLFGLVATPIGFRLWHGLGPSFGLGTGRGRVNRGHALGALIFFVLLILAELWWSWGQA